MEYKKFNNNIKINELREDFIEESFFESRSLWLLANELNKLIPNKYFKNLNLLFFRTMNSFFSSKKFRFSDVNMSYELKYGIELYSSSNLFIKDEISFSELIQKYKKSYVDTIIHFFDQENKSKIQKKYPSLEINKLVKNNAIEMHCLYKKLNIIQHESILSNEATTKIFNEIIKGAEETIAGMFANLIIYLKRENINCDELNSIFISVFSYFFK